MLSIPDRKPSSALKQRPFTQIIDLTEISVAVETPRMLLSNSAWLSLLPPKFLKMSVLAPRGTPLSFCFDLVGISALLKMLLMAFCLGCRAFLISLIRGCLALWSVTSSAGLAGETVGANSDWICSMFSESSAPALTSSVVVTGVVSTLLFCLGAKGKNGLLGLGNLLLLIHFSLFFPLYPKDLGNFSTTSNCSLGFGSSLTISML